ncbi:hypothetical protein [Umezawaea sp. Da 62-37]|uniref:hypothetical protein n=1 Tax=Umezawaea sp. Da 62-37 TaxID=3075927 RepID=UPI0028F71200|nr:hypothetical protein [Umezawaea sp. Da 62-37]WNV85313.1 hypothetical protein RM788_45555 [Umezawaea sp. Da 62-37]
MGWEAEFGTPKTDSGVAIVAVDRGAVLEREAVGDTKIGLGLMFTEPNGYCTWSTSRSAAWAGRAA